MKVLFIGNSYTYFNDLPALFCRVCRENGIEAEADSVTAGGYTLGQYLLKDNEYGIKAKELLEKEKYDFVVLQEQSVRPASEPGRFFEDAGELIKLIKKNGAKPALYETWARADGSAVLTELGWDGDTMQEKLRRSYEKAATDNKAVVVYAGEKLREAYKRGEPVYDPDGSHPSPLGSQIAAEEFYRTLTAQVNKKE